MVERSSRYLHHIVEEIEKRGLPTELALLPMVESAYNPMAYSRSHASGLWQFIPATGKNYKLEQNWWIDQRRDVVASTSAALDYLQYIYEMHGDWHLALASYNWGEGAVGRAIAKNRANGLPTDYLSLTMPQETKHYVPKLQALKNIFSNPRTVAELGLRNVPNRPFFSTIAKPANMDVKVAAKLAEMRVEEFVALNPAHNRPVIMSDTPLVIPTDKVDTFMSNLEHHQNNDLPLSSWQAYTLRAGEKLEKLAPRFGMTVARLKEVNGIEGRIKLGPGFTLLVPGGNGNGLEDRALLRQPRLPEADPPARVAVRTHLVRKGETLAVLGKRYQLTVAELRKINQLRSDKVAPGTRLTLAATGPVEQKPISSATVTKTSGKPVVATLDKRPASKANAAPGGKQAPLAAQQQVRKAKTPKVARYTIRRGDTLASIARHFKMEKDELLRWNRLSPGTLQPGKTLTLQLARNDD